MDNNINSHYNILRKLLHKSENMDLPVKDKTLFHESLDFLLDNDNDVINILGKDCLISLYSLMREIYAGKHPNLTE